MVLERMCGEHFGLDDEDGSESYRRACVVLACSPSTDAAPLEAGGTVCQVAAEAIALDVLSIARARGWYTPAADEDPSNDKLPYFATLTRAT